MPEDLPRADRKRELTNRVEIGAAVQWLQVERVRQKKAYDGLAEYLNTKTVWIKTD